MRHFRSELLLFISLMVTWVHSQDCGKVLTGNSGTFTSPNYPDEYDHKLNCVWTIQAPARHFVKLTLDHMDLKNPFWSCDMDYITIDMGDEGDHKYCNDAPPTDKTIKSVTSTMKITLHTDDFFRNGVGFSASYVIVDRNGKPVESEEDTEEETGKVNATTTEKSVATTTSKPVTTTRKSVATTTAKSVSMKPAEVSSPTTTAETKKRRGKGGKKGRKGKKNKKSKEQRQRERRERKERRARKAKAKALRRKNKKTRERGARKSKRASSQSAQ